jgi:branched-chain amino acid transport system substrate-binding protein
MQLFAPAGRRGEGMNKARKESAGGGATPDQVSPKRRSRRELLIKTGGLLAAGAFGAVPLRGWAADPINIGALYPTTGSMAQIGVGCVAAAKLAVDMVNEAGGIKSLGGARLNLIISDVQSDTTVTRTETDRLITGNKLSAIHGCYASALTLIASEVAERAKVPLITGSSSDQLNKGRTYTFTPFARASQFARAQLQMSKLVSDTPKVAVIFENTAFGTSTSNGLKELAPAEGVEIVMFEPVLGLLPERSHSDCTYRQAIRSQCFDQRRFRGLRHSRFLQERRKTCRGLAGCSSLES